MSRSTLNSAVVDGGWQTERGRGKRVWPLKAWLLLACALGMVSLLAGASAVCAAAAQGSGEAQANVGVSGSPLSSTSLVIEGSPEEAEQRRSEEEARLDNPAAVAAREESETADEGMGASEAQALMGRAFPLLVGEAGGGLRLPEGAQVVGYPSDFAATVRLADGSRVVVESLTPIATSSGAGRVPIDLAPQREGSGFAAVNAVAGLGVRIGSRLGEGAWLSAAGLRMTPVTAEGAVLEAEGHVDGAGVFFGDSEDAQAGVVDLDTVEKVGAYGFSEESVLRSQRSPEALYFKVGLPEDASLVQEGEGPVQVMDAGSSIATILAPAARDAEGTFVPVGVSVVDGDVIKLSVPHPAGRFKYPIVVDPYAIDKQIVTEGSHESNWTEWSSPTPPPSGPFHFREFDGYIEDRFEGSHGTGEIWWGRVEYVTQGDSHIGQFGAYVYGSVLPFDDESQYHSEMTIGSKAHVNEAELSVPGYFDEEHVSVCAKPCKTIYEGSENNHASYSQYFEGEGSDGFWTLISRPEVVISQSGTPSAIGKGGPGEQSGLEPLSGKQIEAYNPADVWVNPTQRTTVWAAEGTDPGIGIYRARLKSPQEGETPYANPYSKWIEPLAPCRGIQCEEHQSLMFSLTTACGSSQCSWLPEGQDTVTVEVEDAMTESKAATASQTIDIDEKAPHSIALHGLPANSEVGSGSVQLTAEATDGEGTVKSSGVRSLALYIDGKQVGGTSGSCAPSTQCTAKSAPWTIEPRNYAVGTHTVTVVATDNAGNVASQSFPMIVRTAEPVSLGPGAVNPETGEFSLEGSDVSMGGGLLVGRSYNSEHLTAGADGPLGEQWSLSVGGEQNLEVQANGSVVLTGGAGHQTIFSLKEHEEGFNVPPGDSNLTLSYQAEGGLSHQPAYVLEDAATGSKIYFERSSSESQTWIPTIQKGLTATETVSYVYKSEKVGSKTLIEPKEALAPVPAGIECTLNITEEPAKQLKRGCRALTFNYAEATTAKGEAPSEWGDYDGNLTRVYYTAWSTTANKMQTIEVAHYLYDSKGRLRAEWNPRTEPEAGACVKEPFGKGCLATTYGYDAENHLTSVAPPGQQPWLIRYGTTSTNAASGQVLSVSRPKASVKISTAPAPVNTTVPAISSHEPVGGVELSATSGVWSNSPLQYSYQWEDCNSSGKECAAIPGAVNQSYIPGANDSGHKLVVAVTATNAQGSTTADSTATEVALGAQRPTYASQIFDGAPFRSPTAVAVNSEGDVWALQSGSDVLEEFSSAGALLHKLGSEGTGNGQFKKPDALAVDSKGDVWVADNENKRVQEFSPSGEYLTKISTGRYPTGVAIDSSGHIWVLAGTSSVGEEEVEEFESNGKRLTQFTIAPKGEGVPTQLEEYLPESIAVSSAGNVWLAGNSYGLGKLVEYSSTGKYVAFSEEPSGFKCGCGGLSIDSEGHLWATSGGNKIYEFSSTGKYTTSFGAEGAGNGQLKRALGVVAVKEGHLWVADGGNNRLQELSSSGSYVTQIVPVQENPVAVAVNSEGDLWDVESERDRLAEVSSSGALLRRAGAEGTGNGQFKKPVGLALDSKGDVWVADSENKRIQELSPTGEYLTKITTTFAPGGVTLDQTGHIWAVSTTSSESSVEEFEANGKLLTSFSANAGGEEAGRLEYFHPESIAVTPEGNIWLASDYSGTEYGVMAEFSSTGKYLGLSEETTGFGCGCRGLSADSEGHLWATSGSKTYEFSASTGRFLESFGSEGTGNGQFKHPSGLAIEGKTAVWVADMSNDRLQKFMIPSVAQGPPAAPSEPENATTTVEYNVAVSGEGAPQQMGGKEVEAWGQTKDVPLEAAAIFPADEPQGWPASHYTKATVYYRDSEERTVNVATPGGGIATSEYNEEGDVIRSLSADNRATAIKEGSKSAEVAEHLSTESKYNSEGTELQSTLGPEHLVKLSSGKEVQARSHTIYSYDEGAPETGGPYRLVTKVTQGAQVAGEPEQDLRTTITSYSGQEGLGWKLRTPTSTTVEPAGLDQITSTTYNKETGAVEETRTPGGNAEAVSPPVYASTFGKAGSGEGQFKEASAVAVGLSGEIWVDDRGDGRIEKFSSTGSYEASIESKLGKFAGSWGIAVSPKTGDLFVADSGHNMIFVFGPAGEELRSFGSSGEGALKEPTGISVTPTGEVWVADLDANKVEEFSEEGKYIASVGEGHLKDPGDVSVDNGNLYVTSEHSVAMFTHAGEYTGSFGSLGSEPGKFNEPTEVVAAPGTGDLFVVDEGNERVEEFNPAGKFLTEWGTSGSGNGEFSGISGLAISSAGTIYTSETGGDRVQQFTPAQSGAVRELYSTQWGSDGSGHGEFLYTGEPAVASDGDVLVTDNEADDVQEFTDQGKYLATFGTKGEGNGQMNGPTGLTVNQSTGEILVAECANDRVQVLNSEGKYLREFGRGQLSCPGAVALDSSGDAWVADSDKNRVVEYNSSGTLIASYGTEGAGHVQFDYPTDIKVLGSDVYVSDTYNDRVEILNLKGEWVGQIGSEGNGGGQFKRPEGIAFNSASDLFVLDAGDNRIEEFNPEGHFLQSIATKGVAEGQLNSPQGIAVTAAGDIYVADAGNHRIEKWTPDSQAAHDTKTIYYTAAANSEHKECGEHAEWAQLVCRVEPAGQPEAEGMPALPTTTTTAYNIYGEPESSTQTSGTGSRTTTITYDAAGRVSSTHTTSNVGEAQPAVNEAYSSTTGEMVEQWTEGTEGRKTLSSVYNTLGELESYTDAAGNTTTQSYNIDGQVTQVNDDSSKLAGLEATQSMAYNKTTGQLEELIDSAEGGMTFKGAYDVEGNLTSQSYPNGMTAGYSINSTGETTSVNYQKTTHCSEHCTWFSDSATPTIHGEWATQTSSLSDECYSYDAQGRLTQVQETVLGSNCTTPSAETPAGEGCTTRAYTYDEETNRTSLATTKPNSEGHCGTTTTVERHTYDAGNQLEDEGIKYNAFGDVTSLPAADAGSASTLENHFYADDQLAEQTSGEQTVAYKLDPEDRTLETIDTGKTAGSTITHYAGPGQSNSWTEEPTAKHWLTRYIHGLNGGLAATIENGLGPELQIEDLQGNIVAAASLSETATKLLWTQRSTEYGPTTSKPKRYSFHGSNLLPNEPTGTITMGARDYIPQLGRFLQTDPQPGGSANQYAYTYGNPINQEDPTGELTYGISEAGLAEAEATGARIANEYTARIEAERLAAEAAAAAQQKETPPTEGGASEVAEAEVENMQNGAATASNGVNDDSLAVISCFVVKGHPKARYCGKSKGNKECLPTEYRDKYGHCHKGPKVTRPKKKEGKWCLWELCYEPIVSEARRRH